MIVRMIMVTTVLLVGIQTNIAQTPTSSSSQTASAPTDEIATLSQEWMAAAQRQDAKTLERLMAEDFTLVHPSQDKVTTRAQWLASLLKIETKQFRYEHLKVVHYGGTVAVVSAVFVVDAVLDGHRFSPVTAVTDVWEKRGGRWQVVTRYAVRPEEIKPPAPSVAPN